MQNASQVPQPPQQPIYTPYIQTPYIPAHKKSNGLITASFTIGLILFILGLINTAFSNWLPYLFTRRYGWSIANYGVFTSLLGLLVFFIPGLIGFILGIVGFRRMIKENPPHKYFIAVAGIVLCFGPALWVVNALLITLTSAIVSAAGL